MVFSSLTFLFLYFLIVMLIYKILPFKFRNLWLFIVSLFFYGWGEPKYILIMVFSIICNYFFGYKVKDEKGKKYLILSIIFNLSLLGFFKYTNFIVSIINSIGFNINVSTIQLPIGISFYTFQMMSYPIDVYRNEADTQRSIVNFGAYVTMFPQLIAGPIVRYKDIALQLENREESLTKMYDGIKRFMVGLSKKVLLANNIGYIWDSIIVTPIGEISMLNAWLGIIAFSLQIYFDFSGYSDMAIGLGKMFGFEFLENFNYPYISSSVTEFWRRWHISLSSWFKDYLYIPLGGSRISQFVTIRNLLIVWTLTGLWHGASFNFVLWGLYYGIVLIIEKVFLRKYLKENIISHIYTLFIVLIGWVLFAITDFDLMFKYLRAMFNFNNVIDKRAISNIMNYWFIILIGIIGSFPFIKEKTTKILEKYEWIYPFLVAGSLILCIANIISSSYNPFLYFRF
ncbi:MAG: MBOAT family protein [Erysipelotrichaceae bacterium]|nr:MBOAT family protein [Erysipelotrichaceae bacterium]